MLRWDPAYHADRLFFSSILPFPELDAVVQFFGTESAGKIDPFSCRSREKISYLIVVDLQKPHLQSIHDVVSNLVYCGKASDVETVVVDGRVVVEQRQVLGANLPELFARVDETVRRILAKIRNSQLVC